MTEEERILRLTREQYLWLFVEEHGNEWPDFLPGWEDLKNFPTEDGVYRKWGDDLLYVCSWESFTKILNGSRRYDDLCR